MSPQDFSKKFVIVVRNDLPSWQAMNAASHSAAYLGNKMKERFDSGESFTTKDGKAHPRNSQYPIVVLQATAKELTHLIVNVRTSGLLFLGFFREMVETTDDEKLARLIGKKGDDEVEYLGVGIFGGNEEVKYLTKKFSLWK